MSEKKTNDEDKQQAQRHKPSIPPAASISLHQGDIVIQGQGTESDTYREVFSSVVQEARYWSQNSVFVDEPDRIEQHLYRK